jgi:hypothetical protein
MKKIIGLIFVSLVLSFNTMAQELWKEGVHYNVIAKEATEKLLSFSHFGAHIVITLSL